MSETLERFKKDNADELEEIKKNLIKKQKLIDELADIDKKLSGYEVKLPKIRVNDEGDTPSLNHFAVVVPGFEYEKCDEEYDPNEDYDCVKLVEYGYHYHLDAYSVEFDDFFIEYQVFDGYYETDSVAIGDVLTMKEAEEYAEKHGFSKVRCGDDAYDTEIIFKKFHSTEAERKAFDDTE